MKCGTNIVLLGVAFVRLFLASGMHIQRGLQPSINTYPKAYSNLEPEFDPSMSNNVTAVVGKSVHLVCIVRNAGNRSISWVRHRDLHILTVSGYTYTSDQRFQALHAKGSDEYTLLIKWSQKRDAGKYECQISTTPLKTFEVTLNVVAAPLSYILGGPELYVDIGSTINLTCIVQYCLEPPTYIFWYHNNERTVNATIRKASKNITSKDKVISYDSPRGGVNVLIVKGDITHTSLLMQNAQPSDNGLYSCSPSNADMSTITVHVVKGDGPAAMHTTGGVVFRRGNIIVGFMIFLGRYATDLLTTVA